MLVILWRKQSTENRIIVERKAEDGVYVLQYQKEQAQNIHQEMMYSLFDTDTITIPEMTVHEPIYVNPCSYEATATVLRNIGHMAGVRQDGGEWVIVLCDGVP